MFVLLYSDGLHAIVLCTLSRKLGHDRFADGKKEIMKSVAHFSRTTLSYDAEATLYHHAPPAWPTVHATFSVLSAACMHAYSHFSVAILH